LLRAGRFDRQILVDRPDKKGRADILRVHLKKAKLVADVEPAMIAALTPALRALILPISSMRRHCWRRVATVIT